MLRRSDAEPWTLGVDRVASPILRCPHSSQGQSHPRLEAPAVHVLKVSGTPLLCPGNDPWGNFLKIKPRRGHIMAWLPLVKINKNALSSVLVRALGNSTAIP